jgi:hypothetical protein
MEALNLCVRAVAKPGDTIALESPTYFGLLQILESMGVKALEIPTHPREGISLEALEFALDRSRIAAVIVMPNAQNPLGFTMSDENKKRLVKMLDKRSVPLIEDDVYGDLYYGDDRPLPAKAFDRTGNVMLCSSFTKTVAPGFRLGWVSPGRLHAQVQMAKFINSVGSPEVLQLVVADFLASGGYDRQLRYLRRVFRDQVSHVSTSSPSTFGRHAHHTPGGRLHSLGRTAGRLRFGGIVPAGHPQQYLARAGCVVFRHRPLSQLHSHGLCRTLVAAHRTGNRKARRAGTAATLRPEPARRQLPGTSRAGKSLHHTRTPDRIRDCRLMATVFNFSTQ